jgi:ADP-heptose:LPS heptosyltransferase
MSRIPLDASIRNILVVNFGGIGDEILFFPVIQSLRETYPHAHLTALVEPRCQGIGAFNPAIDQVVTLDIKGRVTPFDLLGTLGTLREQPIDLAIGSGRSPIMPLLLLLSGARYRAGYDANRLSWTLTERARLDSQQYAGEMYYDLVRSWIPIPFRLPQVALSQTDREWAKAFLAEQGVEPGDPVVVLHPGSSRLSVLKGFIKSWDPARWAELAARLQQAGAKVVLAGGPDDAEAIAAIQAALTFSPIMAYGQTRGLGQLAALVAQSTVLVSVDSAPMHLGVAVGTPTVALFGPTDPAKLLPTGTVHQAIHVDGLACRPCLFDKRKTTCEALTCLKDLSVSQVEEAVWRVLPSPQRDGASHAAT